MERRFEVRKQAILNEAKIKPAVSKEMLERLEQFTDPFIKCLKRPDPEAKSIVGPGVLLVVELDRALAADGGLEVGALTGRYDAALGRVGAAVVGVMGVGPDRRRVVTPDPMR